MSRQYLEQKLCTAVGDKLSLKLYRGTICVAFAFIKTDLKTSNTSVNSSNVIRDLVLGYFAARLN